MIPPMGSIRCAGCGEEVDEGECFSIGAEMVCGSCYERLEGSSGQGGIV